MDDLIKELQKLRWKIQFVHGKLCATTGGNEILDYKELTQAAKLIEDLISELN